MTVYLVGAGPGDPDLLTVRAARILSSADIVVFDRLAEPVLSLAPPGARLIDVGKQRGDSWTQASITALLVDLGRDGLDVVRLKGGDPYVFGRGGEEAEALIAAGVDVEVVPGISSALSAPAAAGIPVTHRGLSDMVTVVTGHRQPGDETDWDTLARLGGTVVVLMGVGDRAAIARRLIRGGRHGATPFAAIHAATTIDQTVTRGRLDELGDTPIEAPATLIIGPVASLNLASLRSVVAS
jgi:uroporphyrin-III C-methyltransferase